MYERFGELKIAIGNKKYKQVKEIIAKYPKLVNPPYPFTTNSTDSLLHFAAMNGDTKMTDLLLMLLLISFHRRRSSQKKIIS